jgi:signal transduction histidine kinase/ligand-binding sensor domain-containing protein/DNA-binding response OmpR family regulator
MHLTIICIFEMSVMRLIKLICFIVFPVLVYGNEKPVVSLSKITPDGGVASSQVKTIAEDSIGTIWFGTNNGLFRYDSKKIHRYSHFQNKSTTIPSNRIQSIYTDRSGQVWIATEKGICKYIDLTNEFTTYVIKDQFDNFIGDNIISFFQTSNKEYWFSDVTGVGKINFEENRANYVNINDKATSIEIVHYDKRGTIWVIYSDGEIYYLANELKQFRFFGKIPSEPVLSVYFDETNLWIGYTNNGLLCLNLDGTIKNHYSTTATPEIRIPNNRIRSIIKRSNDQLWVATYEGVLIIEDYKITGLIDQIKHIELPHHSIWSIYEDSQNNVWIGTWMGGLCFHNEYNTSFNHYSKSSSKNSINGNIVTSIVKIPNQNKVLIATDGGSLNVFDPAKNIFYPLKVIYEDIEINNIKSITFDKNETLWLGTYESGVLYREKSSNKFKKLKPPFQTGMQAHYILATVEGLWVSDYPQGVYFYNFKSKEFDRYQHNPFDIKSISNNSVRQILKDKNGDFWFTTENGLNFLKNGSNEFIHYFNEPNNTNSISINFIFAMLEDHEGNLWFGTNGHGLDRFNPVTREFKHYTIENGLAGNEVFSMVFDSDNQLWISTENGLCRLNPKTGIVKSFNSKGIQNNRFHPLSAYTSDGRELYFGGSDILIRFFPDQIISNPVPPKATITRLFINNKEVKPGKSQNILTDNISNTRQIKLNYKQNSFEFHFISNNYINPQENRFRYRLADFNDDWIEVDLNGVATFTNIAPGKYTFEVLAANNDGVWNTIPAKLDITIKPPLWLSWYAYVFYALVIILTIYYFRQQLLNRQQLKAEIEMAKVRNEAEEQLHQMKLQFFTNISHEFRTPLTLIDGPVKRLLKSKLIDKPEFKDQLRLVENNTGRLLRLVNQLLDFRKAESGSLKLKPVRNDLVAFCKHIVECFKDLAVQHKIKLEFSSQSVNLSVDFDPDKLDKILFNLLSNAFKNTPESGSIQVQISDNINTSNQFNAPQYSIGNEIGNEFVEISITDTGTGIPENNLSQIFERFYQSDNSSTSTGSGIGLALTKNFIELHNGQLLVKSSVNRGTSFLIYLPKVQDGALHTNEKIKDTLRVIDQNTKITAHSRTGEQVSKSDDHATILIVEDNHELRKYIADLLSERYRIVKARNGKEGLDLAHSLFPDLIVSDIMMPEMDGIELCEVLKTDIRSSHIPVILLTALDTVNDRVTGLQSGADAYIPKPFNDDLLLAQIDNLLQSRKSLRQLFSTVNNSEWETNVSSLSLDKKFVQDAMRIINLNIDNTAFSVDDLAKKLHLHRAHLHRKLKSLCDQSATDLIRSIRLQKAVELLKKGDLNINEIGYTVGFNSPTYFSKSFKQYYGISPSEFIHKMLESQG